MTNGISETVHAEEFREFKRPVVLAPNPYTIQQGRVTTSAQSTGTQVMRQVEPQPDDPIRPLDWLKAIPFEPAAWSDRLGWVGMEAVCCRTEPAFELDQSALTHHWLALFVRPPQELDLRYEGVRRHRPPPVGSIMLVPAGSPAAWRWSGR